MTTFSDGHLNTPWYADLPDGAAQGVFGTKDALGTLNRQSQLSILRAARVVQQGTVFSLNLPLDQPDPPLFSRQQPEHRVWRTPRGNYDDLLDNFYLQASSQWDGFLHIRDPELGFYNGLDAQDHGIHHWAARGIVGRGVVIDVSSALAGTGGRIGKYEERCEIDVDVIEDARSRAGLELEPGDILLVYTGWLAWYAGLDQGRREAVRDSRIAPGLKSCPEMAAYLWDHGLSAVAADNPGVEALPLKDDSLHRRVLARLGMPLGELWRLEDLVSNCRGDGRYECLVVSAPLHVRGGVGSPANAIALK